MKKIIHSLGCKSALLYFVFSLLTLQGQDKSTVMQSSTVSSSIKTKITDRLDSSFLKNGPLTESKNSDNKSPLERMKGQEEDLSKRDAFSRHFKNNDGTYTAIIGTGPLNYQNNGKWEEIDTKIIKDNNSLYRYVNKTNGLQSFFSEKLLQGIMTKTEEGDVKEFLNTAMYWEVNGAIQNRVAANQVFADVMDNQVLYNNIYGNIDAEFTVLNLKRKLNYIIPDQESLGNIPANASHLVFSEDIEIPNGWNYKIDDRNNVLLQDGSGATVLVYEKPSVLENYGSSDSMIASAESPATFVVSKNGNVIRFLLKIDTKWLLDNERKFPLAIDPTVTPNNTFGWTGWASNLGGNNDIVYTGFYTDGAPMAGFMRFNLGSIPDNTVIASVTASVNLYTANGTLANRQISITDVTSDPLATPIYVDIFNSVTSYLSGNLTLSNTAGVRNIALDASGISYVQDGLINNFVTLALYPSNNVNWFTNNYGGFYGYSSGNRPTLTINYALSCTTPSAVAATHYITNVKFIGTLNQDTDNTSTFNGTRYNDYTALTAKAKQIPGGGINVNVATTGGSAFLKAWVDWNNNGLYDNTERVYDTGTILTSNTIFGFVVPIGTAPGTYKIRIRNYRNSPYFPSCGALANGETEDYSFIVIADCPAKITATNISATDGRRCGAGAVSVSATGTGTTFQWYTDEFGNTPIALATTGTYTTPSLPVGNYTYYVTSKNGTCESVFRTPVKVVVSPTPTITLTQSTSTICGDAVGMSLTSSGDKEEVTLLSENFTSGLGAFQNINGMNTNANGFWINRPSPYIPTTPPYTVVKPALSSGNDGANFASMNTDLNQTSSILNHLTLQNNLNTTGYLNLKLDFDLYYYSYIDNDELSGFLKVDYSTNGGTNWTNLTTITTDAGIPSKWSKQSFVLPAALLNQTQVKFRISMYGMSDVAGWIPNISGVDNVRVYGDKPLNTNFTWSAPNITVYNADCTTPYSGASTSVCIRPDSTQIENFQNWTISASATLSNGCTASNSVVITNDTRVYNLPGTNWNGNGNWKPVAAKPDATKCVIVKQQANINASISAFAKNIKIENGGQVQIIGSLTVTDGIINLGNADALTVKTDGNLIQINDAAINNGAMIAQKLFTFVNGSAPANDRKQYNYVISPVIGQNIKTIYPGNPTVIFHNEANNFFYASDGAYVAGKGLGIKEPSKTAVPSGTVTANYVGSPFNGVLNYPLAYSTTQVDPLNRGFNLVGNPYPSNLSVENLYDANVSKVGATFYFWDNRGNVQYTQLGSSYSGDNYAKYNAVSGTGVGTGQQATSDPTATRIPNQYVKVGTAFMVQALPGTNGQNLKFSNTMRTASSGPGFFGKDSVSVAKDRFWLILKTPSNIEYMNAVVYLNQGSKEFGKEDTESFGSSDDIYSTVDDHRLAIQGRDLFADTDKVNLGLSLFQTGMHTISLDHPEGIFDSNQNIYLKDKQEGIITNLSQGSYTFAASSGDNTTRFEIVYKPETVLATDAAVQDDLVVYRTGNDFMVKSKRKKIDIVELYDTAGRLIYMAQPKNKEVLIPAEKMINSIYILKIDRNGIISTQKIRR